MDAAVRDVVQHVGEIYNLADFMGALIRTDRKAVLQTIQDAIGSK